MKKHLEEEDLDIVVICVCVVGGEGGACVYALLCVCVGACDDDDELMLNVLRCHLTY